MANLASLVQALPQELVDEIFNLTVTLDSEPRYVDRKDRPPSNLQVNRATRSRLLPSYYGKDSKFYMREGDLVRWMCTRPVVTSNCLTGHAEIDACLIAHSFARDHDIRPWRASITVSSVLLLMSRTSMFQDAKAGTLTSYVYDDLEDIKEAYKGPYQPERWISINDAYEYWEARAESDEECDRS